MTGNGSVSLVAADFRPLNRAWPGTAASSSVILDDTDGQKNAESTGVALVHDYVIAYLDP